MIVTLFVLKCNMLLCYNVRINEKENGDSSMKKRILALLMSAALVVSMTGCSDGKLSNDKITINKYKGLEVEEMSTTVTDKDVEDSIRSTMSAMELGKVKNVKDRGAEYGDTIVMDYTGYKDGVAFDNGAEKDKEGVLGSIGFIDGFESSIVGHKAGEEFDINVTFPENYQSTELAGQPVVFKIKLKKVTTTEYPELTDDVATKLNGSEITAEEYQKKERANLEKSNKETAESALEQNLWQALVEQCVVDSYDKEALSSKQSEVEQRYSTIASYYSMDVATFVQNYYGMSVENMAKELLKQEYAIELIAEKEKLTVTDEDYTAGLKKYAEEAGYDSTDEEKLKEFEEMVTKDVIKQQLLQEKVTAILVDNCVRKPASTEE